MFLNDGKKSPIDCLNQFVKHLNVFKSFCISDNNVMIPSEIQEQIFKQSFISTVKQEILLLTPIWDIINIIKVHDSLIGVTEKFLKLKSPRMDLKDLFETAVNKGLSIYGLVGYYLSPSCDRQLLVTSMRRINTFIMNQENQGSVGIVSSFAKFIRNTNEFEELKTRNLKYIDFWTFIKEGNKDHEILAKLALRLYNMTTSAYLENIPEFTGDKKDKMMTICLSTLDN